MHQHLSGKILRQNQLISMESLEVNQNKSLLSSTLDNFDRQIYATDQQTVLTKGKKSKRVQNKGNYHRLLVVLRFNFYLTILCRSLN